MLPAIFKLYYFWAVLLLAFVVGSPVQALEKKPPGIKAQLNELFSHKTHDAVFSKAKVSCTDCHSFAVKAKGFDPLEPNVTGGFLKAKVQVCHQCHIGKVEVARINQCSLCHSSVYQLKPANHNLVWGKRHGTFAQANPQSCTACHQANENSCHNCHSQKNNLRTLVHRANFRMTHGLEARVNPGKCTICHASSSLGASSCVQCHKGGLR